jgi:tetratricopeptide (TPR) repeat protein
MDDARKSFDRATKVNKRFSDAYNNLGATYYAEKQYKRAISQYQRSLSLRPDVASVYTNIGYAYFAQKQLPKAMEAFHKALELDPHVFEETGRAGSILSYRSVTDRGLFNFMLAKNYAQSGDAPNCMVYLRRAADEGYKEVGKARTDPDFAKVIDDPNLKALLDEIAPLPATPPAAPRS